MRQVEGLETTRNERLRAPFASLAEIAGNGERCPAAARLWDSARGRLTGRAHEELILHLGECGACAAAWRLARELNAGERRGGVLARPADWLRLRWVPTVAAAALLLVVVGVAVRHLRSPRGTPAEFREATNACVASLVPPGGSLPRGSLVLRWSGCPEGTTYDVRVTTENLDIVARARELEKPEFVVPMESLARVPGGGRIVWQVTAHLPDGGVSESQSYTTEVR